METFFRVVTARYTIHVCVCTGTRTLGTTKVEKISFPRFTVDDQDSGTRPSKGRGKERQLPARIPKAERRDSSDTAHSHVSSRCRKISPCRRTTMTPGLGGELKTLHEKNLSKTGWKS